MKTEYKKIIPIHYKLSKPVESFKDIKEKAIATRDFMDSARYEGYYNKAFAIAHCQVDETPYSFFVVSEEVLAEKMFPSRIIINPVILEKKMTREIGVANGISPVNNVVTYEEACMSFPFRQPKKIHRYDRIKIHYQIPTALGGLKSIQEEAMGIKSQIFQHEVEHCNAHNIYFYPSKPVAWWDLIGTERPNITGSSIDRKAESAECGVIARDRFINYSRKFNEER